jgi:hypothetical protein
MVWFVGLAHFQHCAASLLSCTGTFDSSCVHSLAAISVLTYGVKTTEQQCGSRIELRHKRNAPYNIYLRKLERIDVDVFERIIFMSKNDNLCGCIGFRWLRVKSNVWLCKGHKPLSSVRAWNVVIWVSKKDCTVKVFG